MAKNNKARGLKRTKFLARSLNPSLNKMTERGDDKLSIKKIVERVQRRKIKERMKVLSKLE